MADLIPFRHPLPVLPDAVGYFTYILHCADGTFYTGWTTHVTRRTALHNRGKGAKYTRTRLPVTVKAVWEFQTQSEAMRWERFLKTLPRSEKMRLAGIAGNYTAG